MAVLNAAMEVFGTYEYRKAPTDLIAAKAGVSKGLLFYYFHDKKSLYMKTYEYMSQLCVEAICDPYLFGITDFFEAVTYATDKKMQLLKQNPHILSFGVRAYYSEKEAVSDMIQTVTCNEISRAYKYFRNLDYSKFKEGVGPERIFNMLVWLTDGYVHMQYMEGIPLDVAKAEQEFAEWVRMLKSIAYKEEFQ